MTDIISVPELEALVDRLNRELTTARAALNLRRNPSSPSHVTKSQAARILGVPPCAVTSMVKTKVLSTETHYGLEMVPMWSVFQVKK